jgi:aminoglycoside phosphotransferase (APT) family kinase protein
MHGPDVAPAHEDKGIEMPKDDHSPMLDTPSGQVVVADRGRDLKATAEHLAAWLSGKIEGAGKVNVSALSYPIGAGHSNETILFNAHWDENGRSKTKGFVVRLHPGDYQLFLDPAFDRQFRLLDLIGRNGWAPVPKVLLQEPDPAVLGRPFFVMEKVTGRVPVSFPVYNISGWLAEAAPRDRERAWLSAMDQFARIHRIPADEVRFMHRPQYGATGFEDEFQYWMHALDWSAGEQTPAVCTAAKEWLTQNKPAAPAEGLSWGDARIGNMIFDDNFQVSAVLDWEQASLAGGLQDLGWWLFFDELYSTGIGVKRLEGLGTRQQTIDLWQELTGQRATDLHWYEAFATFKTKVLSVRGDLLKKKPIATDDYLSRKLHNLPGLASLADSN